MISSKISSLPEVVGGAGLLIDPYSTDAISAAIQSMDADVALRDRLGAATQAQAAKFTDDAFATRLRAVYDTLGLSWFS